MKMRFLLVLLLLLTGCSGLNTDKLTKKTSVVKPVKSKVKHEKPLPVDANVLAYNSLPASLQVPANWSMPAGIDSKTNRIVPVVIRWINDSQPVIVRIADVNQWPLHFDFSNFPSLPVKVQMSDLPRRFLIIVTVVLLFVVLACCAALLAAISAIKATSNIKTVNKK